MASLFHRMVSLQDVKKRSEQFSKQIEKLEEERSRMDGDPNGKDQLNFRRRCADLHKQLDQFAQKAADAKHDVKIPDFDQQKHEQIQRLHSFIDKLDGWLGNKAQDGQTAMTAAEEKPSAPPLEHELQHGHVQAEATTSEHASGALAESVPDAQDDQNGSVGGDGEDKQVEQVPEEQMPEEQVEQMPEEQVEQMPEEQVEQMPEDQVPEQSVKPSEQRHRRQAPITGQAIEKQEDNAPIQGTRAEVWQSSQGSRTMVQDQRPNVQDQGHSRDQGPSRAQDQGPSRAQDQGPSRVQDQGPMGRVQPHRQNLIEERAVHRSVEEMEAEGSLVQLDAYRFEALADFQSLQNTDLSFHKGDVFTIIATRPDGWWMGVNDRDQQGLIPKTYLKVHSKYEDVPLNEGEDEEQEEVVDVQLVEQRRRQHEEQQSQERQQQQEQQQQQVRQRSAMEVMQSMGALPAGCGPSDLARMHNQDTHLSYSCHLLPRLSESNLGFHDLYWNGEANKLRKRRIRVSKCMRLLKLENVSGTDLGGLEVQSRHIRICLFDATGSTGKQIVSNVHTIRAAYNSKNPKIWTFVSKMDGNHSSLDFADFFVRSNYAQKEVVLFFEAAVSFFRPTTGERGEFSVGWAVLPLLAESTNTVLSDKVHHVILKTGSPFQTGANLTENASNNRPKLSIKVYAPGKNFIEQLDSLPDVLIWNTLFIPFTFYYRRIAGQLLIRDRLNMQNAELIGEPFLALLPACAEQPDVMDVLHRLWIDRESRLDRNIKKSEESLAEEFRRFVLDTAFALCHSADVPPFSLVNNLHLQIRAASFARFFDLYTKHKSVSHFLASEKCKPFDLFDYAIDLVGPHAID